MIVIPKNVNEVFFEYYFAGNAVINNEPKHIAIQYSPQRNGKKYKKWQRKHHSFMYPATRFIRTSRQLFDIQEDEEEEEENECLPMIVSNCCEWTMQHDDIICTMSELLFQISKYFHTGPIKQLIKTFEEQLDELKANTEKRQQLIIFGYIGSHNDRISIDVKKLICNYCMTYS